MKVLVTGGAGYIGSFVVREFLLANHEVYVVDDLSTGFLENIPKNVQFFQGSTLDITFLESVFKKSKIDVVVHLAAKLVVPESITQPLSYFENNVQGTLNILKFCEQFQIKKFIFSSTAAVYGDFKGERVSEEAIPNPINPYGESKLMAEKVIHYFAQAHPEFKYVILRYFNVAGAAFDQSLGQLNKNASHLIKAVCDAALGIRSSVDVFGTDFPTPDGSGVRDYIHVQDLAMAHYSALEYLAKGLPSDIFNCGYSRGFSVLEVVSEIKKISKVDFPINLKQRRFGDPACVVANTEKILKKLLWKPKYDNLNLICNSSYAWEKNKILNSGLK